MTLLLLLLLWLLQAFLCTGARINVSKEELFCFKLDVPTLIPSCTLMMKMI
jgi:hypothetical protein